MRLIVEELGFVEEPAGGTYFSFSGGVEIGSASGTSTQPSGTRTDNKRHRDRHPFPATALPDLGHRLAPPWKLDGILLDINYGQVSITGFGYITDDIESGYRYQEFGFGVQVKFPLMADDFKVAAEFLKGTSTEVAPPNTSFSYLFASLQVELGARQARSRSTRCARCSPTTCSPRSTPPATGPQSMQLYQWHKDHDGAHGHATRRATSPTGSPSTTPWRSGIAAGFSFTSSGQLFHIGIFMLVTQSETDTGDPHRRRAVTC